MLTGNWFDGSVGCTRGVPVRLGTGVLRGNAVPVGKAVAPGSEVAAGVPIGVVESPGVGVLLR